MSKFEALTDTPPEDSQSSISTQPLGSPSPMTELVWARFFPSCSSHADDSLNQVIEFRSATTSLGRDASNDVQLRCPMLSSLHCKIISDEQHGHRAVFLEDVSSNGTWVAKQRINKKRVLLSEGVEVILVPGSKRTKRPKLSYMFQLAKTQKRTISPLESKYWIQHDLGAGAFSTVKLVRDRSTHNHYALKVIDRDAWRRLQHATNRHVKLLDEVAIMKKADHPNILKVHEYFEEERVVNVVLDYCSGGNMLEYIQKHDAYTSQKARTLFRQMIDGVAYLHGLNIAHRDLKPDNLLLSDESGDQLKISDFGISREQSKTIGCGTIIGTPLYQAPEVHNRRDDTSRGYDGTLADYWSLGVILYVMLVAAPPISPNEQASRICVLSEMKTLPWYDEPVPETAKDLIYKLLQTDPIRRMTAPKVYEHPWMKGFDTWSDVPKDMIEQSGSVCVERKEQDERDESKDMEEDNESTSSAKESLSASSSGGSKKRKANFDDDEEMKDMMRQPPCKKQRSNPKQLQECDVKPVKFVQQRHNSI